MAPPKLPVIEISVKNLNPTSSSWITKCNEVMDALEEYGCFIAMIFLASQDLFDLPIEVKVLNTSDKPYHGYSGQIPAMPLYESLGIENATTTEGIETFTKLMWPSGNKNFCTSALMFSKAVAELYEIVMVMVAKSFGIEEHCESFLRSTVPLLRFQKYLSPKQKEENPLGLLPHTDVSFLTILRQKQVKGVEIKTKDGQWIEVEPSPSSFIVMAGDACTAFTNGRIEGACHRVIMEGTQERYSLGLFMFIRDSKIEIPQKLIDEDHPQRFKEFDHYKYLNYHSNEGKSSKCPIESYCGI